MVYGQEARNALVKGISQLAKVGKITLGPGGRNVALDYEGGDPKITKDGVTVIKTCSLKNRAEDMGAKLLKKTAGNTNLYAGDGTTSSTLLSEEILIHGQKAIQFEGAHPIAIKRGLDKGLKVVNKFLNEIALPIT